MDPVSIVASVAAVIALADTVIQKSCTVYERMKRNDYDLHALLDSVASLSGLLGSLRPLLELDRTRAAALVRHRQSIERALESCNEDLEAVVELVDALAEASRISLFVKGETIRHLIVKLVQMVEQYKAYFMLCLQLRNSSRSASLDIRLTDLLQGLSDVREGQDAITSCLHVMRQERAAGKKGRMLQWLGRQTEATHLDLCRERDDDSAEWVTERSEFLNWINSEETAVLWLNGKKGCGKSVVVSKIVATVQEYTSRFHGHLGAPCYAVAYRYCHFSDLETLSPDKLLGDLLAQVFSQAPTALTDPVLQPLERLHDRHSRTGIYPTICELEPVFLQLCRQLQKVYLVVDGLDEVPDSRQLNEFLDRLAATEKNLCILISCRPEAQHLPQILATCPVITMEPDSIAGDIERYIHTRLQAMRLRPAEQDLVQRKLEAGANGMFLWVVCQLDRLGHAWRITESQLDGLPRDLEGTFEAILLRLREDDIIPAKLFLQLIMSAKEPLSLAELVEATTMLLLPETQNLQELRRSKPPDDRLIFRICGSLVRESATTGKITLSHYSVQEFLTAQYLADGRRNMFYIDLADPSFDMALLCLNYLNLDDFGADEFRCSIQTCSMQMMTDANNPGYEQGLPLPQDTPFFEYASRHWTDHLLQSSCDGLDKPCTMALNSFSNPRRGNFASWAAVANLLRGGRKYPDGIGPIHVAAIHGLSDVVQLLVENAPGIVASALPDGRTALHLALENGQDMATKALLDHGAPLYMEDYQHRTPLHVAAETGNYVAVIRMVTAGADVNAGNDDWLTPISVAIENKRDNLAPFLAPMARLDWHLPDGSSLLHLSAQAGSVIWTRALVSRIKDGGGAASHDDLLDEQDELKRAPLHYAASGGHLDVVRLLLEAGAYPEPMDLFGWTPLHAAAGHQRHGCLGLLLAADVQNPPARPFQQGRATPGPAAAEESPAATSSRQTKSHTSQKKEWLIRDIPDGEQPSVLLVAASNADTRTVRLLLERLDSHGHESRRLGADAMVKCFGKSLSLGDTATLRLLVPRVSAGYSHSRETVLELRRLVEQQGGPAAAAAAAAAAVPNRDALVAVLRGGWAAEHRYRLLLTAHEAREVGVLSLGLDMWPTAISAAADLPAGDDARHAASVRGVEAERDRVPDGGRGSMAYVLVRKRKRPLQW